MRRLFLLVSMLAVMACALVVMSGTALAQDGSDSTAVTAAGAALGVVAVVGIPTLIIKILDFGKDLAHQRWRDAGLQAGAWLAAFVVLWLFAQTRYAAGIDVGGFGLADADVAELVLLALSVGSAGSVVYDAAVKPKRQRDPNSLF